MAVKSIDTKLIHPNLYQPRLLMDPAKVKELAESIKAHGLLEPPQVRAVNGTYQLVFGHRRLAAWKIARPGQPFPCEPVTLDDRAMFERAIAENDDREPLNSVERARALKRYIDEFKTSQAEAAPRFKLKSQSAVSNMLRLLDLPAEILDLVAQGQITERLARTLIIPARVYPAEVLRLVQEALKDGDGDPVQAAGDIADEIGELARKNGKRLSEARWDKRATPKVVVNGQTEQRACIGCPFIMKSRYGGDICMRAECYTGKQQWYAAADLAQASKKIGIPLRKGNEESDFVWDGSWDLIDQAKRWVKNKLPHLRLDFGPGGYYGNNRATVLGSEYAALYTTDDEWLDKVMDAKKKREMGRAYDPKRDEEAKRQRDANVAHCYQLVDNAAPAFTAVLSKVPDPVLAVFGQILCESRDVRASKRPMKEIQKLPAAARRLIAAQSLIEMECKWKSVTSLHSSQDDPRKTEKRIVDLARAWKVKLPPRWNIVNAKPADVKPAEKKGRKK